MHALYQQFLGSRIGSLAKVKVWSCGVGIALAAAPRAKDLLLHHACHGFCFTSMRFRSPTCSSFS